MSARRKHRSIVLRKQSSGTSVLITTDLIGSVTDTVVPVRACVGVLFVRSLSPPLNPVYFLFVPCYF
jgi:hypothetical protein